MRIWWCSSCCLCDMMLGIRCVGVCGCQSEDSFVHHGAKPTQRACVRDLPRDQKKTREGRSQRDSQEMRVGKKGDQLTKSERRLLRPVDRQMLGWPTREEKSALLVAYRRFAQVHTRICPQKHRMRKSVTDFFFLALWVNPNPCLVVLLFFHPLGCVIRIRKEKWYTPGRRWEKPRDESMAISGSRKLR